jgi:hypothetical protein
MEIFAYNSFGTLKESEICVLPNRQVIKDFPIDPPPKFVESNELEYKEREV